MKITIYTIKDCAFSKQEKQYLNTNKLFFEEKDLETNKEFLTEMLAVSNNFAGTPVTKIEKDDGTISVLKGFTKEEFDTTLGLAPVSSDAPITDKPITDSTASPQVNDTPIATPPVAETPTAIPAETVPPVPTPAVTEAPVAVTPDPLKSVMDDLQSKSGPTTVPPAEAPVPPTPVVPTDSTVPVTPPSVDPTAPTIPDFPVK